MITMTGFNAVITPDVIASKATSAAFNAGLLGKTVEFMDPQSREGTYSDEPLYYFPVKFDGVLNNVYLDTVLNRVSFVDEQGTLTSVREELAKGRFVSRGEIVKTIPAFDRAGLPYYSSLLVDGQKMLKLFPELSAERRKKRNDLNVLRDYNAAVRSNITQVALDTFLTKEGTLTDEAEKLHRLVDIHIKVLDWATE
jgi:hypothetical protein